MIDAHKPRPHGWLKTLAITQIALGGLSVLGAIGHLIRSSSLVAELLTAEHAQSIRITIGQAALLGLLLLGGILMLRGKRSGVILSEIIYGLSVLMVLAIGVMIAFTNPDAPLLGAVGYTLIGGTFFGLPLLYLINSEQAWLIRYESWRK
jgi:hypothetical protein